MRTTVKTLASLSVLATLAAPALPAAEQPIAANAHPATCSGCGQETYGTSIAWAGSPAEAAVRAKKEEKLVFVLHVSGHFEDAAFT